MKLARLALCCVLFVVFPAVSGFGAAPAGWTAVYGTLEGPEGRAVELLTSELGDLLLRAPGVYAAHVLPCRAAAKLVHALGPDVEMNGAVQCNGPIRFPTALMAELFWSTNESLETIRRRVLARTRR